MEAILKQQLEPNERILWMGRTKKGGISRPSDRKNQMVRWIVMAVCLAAAVGVFTYAMGQEGGRHQLLLADAFLAVFPTLYALQPVIDQRTLEKNTLCAITDQRVISVVGDTVRFLPRAGLEWKVSEKEGTVGTIRLGGALYNKKKNDRIDAAVGVPTSKDRPLGIVFYQIDKVDEVCKLL